MAWVDQTALENAITEQVLIELTDDADNPSAVDATVMNAAINLAVSTIKGALKKRYAAQCTNETTSLDISEIAICLAVRNLLGRRMNYPITKEWADRIERATTTLESMRRGVQGVAEWSEIDAVAIQEHYFPDSESFDEWESTRETADF